MSKLRRIQVGLPKPPLGKTKPIFYASLNGVITPEIGSNPTASYPNVNATTGYYTGGLQVVGGLQYVIQGLDLAKDFTFAFTITNTGKQVAKSGWYYICALNLKTSSDNFYMSSSIFNLSYQPKNYEGSSADFYFPSTSLPEHKNAGNENSFKNLDRNTLQEVNRPFRFTFASKSGILELYLDDKLVDSVKLGNLESKYLGKPDLLLNINGASHDLLFGTSEVLITQEYVPPIPSISSVESIITPALNYSDCVCQTEIPCFGFDVKLPAKYSDGQNYTSGYVKGVKGGACIPSQPNVYLHARNNNSTWMQGDVIKVLSFIGEVLNNSPRVYYKNGESEVNINGSWSGVGSSVATFTLGDNSSMPANSDIYLDCNCALPKKNYSILGDYSIEKCVSLKYKNKVYYPQANSASMGNAKATRFKLINFPNSTVNETTISNSFFDFVKETCTGCIKQFKEHFEILAYMKEVPIDLKELSSKDNIVAKCNPFISSVSFNKLLPEYNSLNGWILNKLLSSDIKSKMLFETDGSPINFNSLPSLYSSRKFTPINEFKGVSSNNVVTNGLDIGDISITPLKPIVVQPYLFKSNGELKVRLVISYVTTLSTSIAKSNTTTLGFINISTGIFEK